MPLTPQQRTKLSHALQRVSRKLDKMLEQETGSRVGFSLVIWGAFGEDQMIQYTSNCHRDEVKKYMGDLLAAWGQGMPDIPYHERN